MAAPRWKPSATVAAIIERDGQFLLIEEHTPEGVRLNNPAGHLDPGESPAQACVRETLEETAYAFIPTALVGVYLSRFERAASATHPHGEDITYLRFAFCGTLGEWDAHRPLDRGIIRTLWMSPDEVQASKQHHRSAAVVQCMEDYLAGRRYPLELLTTDPSVYKPRT